MLRQIRELDWKTPLKSFNVISHWRICLGILVFAALSVAILHMAFPHTQTFMKLWAGFSTGAVLGTLVGGYWQIRDKKHRKVTSGFFLLVAFFGWGLFATIAMSMVVPQMRAEEAMLTQIQSIHSRNLERIEIWNGATSIVAEDKEIIDQFRAITTNAKLFYPNHEGATEEYELELHFTNHEPLVFQAHIPERHQNDISLSFRGPMSWANILIPGGRHWINSATKKQTQQATSPNR